MTLKQLQQVVSTPYFTTNQLAKVFPFESPDSRNMQLKRLVDTHELVRLKRGLFTFIDREIDEFSLANIIYPQSYVSLESMLSAYGVIPDVPGQVTSVSPLTSKTIVTSKGTFSYSKINPHLYFGFRMENTESGIAQRVAEPEKALLDFVYIRKVKNLHENRVDTRSLNKTRLTTLSKIFPDWVREVLRQV